MGRRTTKPKPGSPWPLIILFLLPLAGMAALMLAISSVPPRSAGELRAERDRLQKVSAAVADMGATMTSKGSIHIITLPGEQALSITPRAAMEIAMTARDRTGGIVRVVTPAGQVLAETD